MHRGITRGILKSIRLPSVIVMLMLNSNGFGLSFDVVIDLVIERWTELEMKFDFNFGLSSMFLFGSVLTYVVTYIHGFCLIVELSDFLVCFPLSLLQSLLPCLSGT